MAHPEYWIGKPGGCTGCIKFETGFTPLAGREKIQELTDFNLSCLTSLIPCTKEADIMPSAWKQFQKELPGVMARSNTNRQEDFPLEFDGRESETIVLAEVVSLQGLMLPGSDRASSTRLRILQAMKGSVPWPKERILTFGDDYNENSNEEIHGQSDTDMLPGKRYFIFGEFQEDHSGRKVLVLDPRGIVPDSEQNLAAIQRGIDQSLARRIPDK
jgi:hypothetical protein